MFFQQAIKTIFIILLLLFSNVCMAAAEYEQRVTLSAKSILESRLLKGKYHVVQDNVNNDSMFNHYTVESDFGVFQVHSSSDLKILVHEFKAIAAMKNVEVDETALKGLKESGEKTWTGLKKLFEEPKGTLDGAVDGVSGLFNRVKGTVGRRKATAAEDSRFEQLIGISKSKGKIATQYGVNVYSTNPALQEELDRLGRADFAGGLGVGIATSFVPGVGGLVLSVSGTARLLNEAINTTPASELWLQNKNKLLDMDVDDDTVELFLNNPSFSPAHSTVLVTALDSMKGVENRALFIKVALQAADLSMAKTITAIAVLTASYHKEIAPLERVTPMARLTQAIRKDGTRVVLLPTDYIIWSSRIADTATTIKREAKGKGLELWLLGSLSKQATAELKELGWELHAEAGSRLLPKRK